MKSLRVRAKNSAPLQLVLVVLGAILPAATLLAFQDLNGINPYGLLWVGFYSCVLSILFCKKRPVAALLVVLNVLPIGLWLFFSLMGGYQGLLAMSVKMVLPFLPMDLLYDGANTLLPPEQYPPV